MNQAETHDPPYPSTMQHYIPKLATSAHATIKGVYPTDSETSNRSSVFGTSEFRKEDASSLTGMNGTGMQNYASAFSLSPPHKRLPGVSALIAGFNFSSSLRDMHEVRSFNHRSMLSSHTVNGSICSAESAANSAIETEKQKTKCAISTQGPRTQTSITTTQDGRPGKRPRSESNFLGLVQIMLYHPLLPLIFKGTYEASTGSALILEDEQSAESVHRALEESSKLAEISKNIGLRTMIHDKEGVDLFFVVLHTVLNQLRDSNHLPISSTLDSMMSACAKGPERASSLKRGSPIWSTSPITTPSFIINTRTKLGENARKVLDKWFQDHYDDPYPSEEEKIRLADECDLQLNQINNYFGNRRMRAKRKFLVNQKVAQLYLAGPEPEQSLQHSTLGPKKKWKAFVQSEKEGKAKVVDSGDDIISNQLAAVPTIRDFKPRRFSNHPGTISS